MKKVFLVLAILAAGWWLNSCDNGVSNTSPHDFTQTPTEPILLSATPEIDGTTTYESLLPFTGEKRLNEQWDGIGIQIDDGPIMPLYAAENQRAYYWKYRTVDGNVRIRWGHFKRVGPDSVDWANSGNLPANWVVEVPDKGLYVGITFRGGAFGPMVQPPLTKLQAIIIVSTHEAATGDEIWFDGSQSTGNANPKSEIIIWDWDFGDGAVANGRAINHAYQFAGTYQVTLTVTDDQGNKHKAQTEISVVPTVGPGEFGDSYHRFHFDFLRNVVLAYYNFDKAKGNFVGKPNVFGNFNGPEQPWKLYYVGAGLQFDPFHTGWGYVEIPLTQPIIALKSGYSQWYEGSADNPDFSRSNFDHMKFGFNFNGQDFSDIIYSSGQIEKGP